MFAKFLIAVITLASLAACAGDRGLRDMDTGGFGPDEFAVLPSLPLEIPAELTLPPPTPGGTNRTDRNPVAEGIVALGGVPAAAFAGGVPARDAALVAHAGRAGVDPAIRATLAAEDAALRARAAVGGGLNILGRDRYFPAYAFMALDAYAELFRFRNLGVAVPSAPPPN